MLSAGSVELKVGLVELVSNEWNPHERVVVNKLQCFQVAHYVYYMQQCTSSDSSLNANPSLQVTNRIVDQELSLSVLEVMNFFDIEQPHFSILTNVHRA